MPITTRSALDDLADTLAAQIGDDDARTFVDTHASLLDLATRAQLAEMVAARRARPTYTDAAAHAAAALGARLHGIAWPCASDGDDSLPYVERDDEADVYADDIEAAYALVAMLGGDARVMFAPRHDAHEWEAHLQPFVLAPGA